MLAILVLQSLQVSQSSNVEEQLCTGTLATAPQCYDSNGNWVSGNIAYVPQACLNAENTQRAPSDDCNAANNNLFYVGGATPATATGWCCGPDPRT